MKYSIPIIIFFSDLMIYPALGAENQCISMAMALGNPFKPLTVDERQAVAKSIMCLRDYATSNDDVERLKIEIGFNEFTGSKAGGSSDLIKAGQAKYCEGHFYDYWSREIKSIDGGGVSKDLTTSLAGCLALQDPAPHFPK